MEKNPELEDLDDVAKKVGIGAVVFGDLYNSLNKDEIFDLDEMLNLGYSIWDVEEGTYVVFDCIGEDIYTTVYED